MTRVGTPVRNDARSLLVLPRAVDRRVIVLAWASLVIELTVIGTGGLVRLTASGLGCPTWPRCTADSLVSTPEMGIHGLIEFGNRMLTGVVVIIAIAMFLAVVRMWHTRRDLWWLAFAQGVAIPVEAVIGGLSVLTNLNPYVVGLHFIVSITLVSVTGRLVYRSLNGPKAPGAMVPSWYRSLVRALMVAVAVTVLLGILTTGSGPHAGALSSTSGTKLARTGLDPAIIETLHAIPAFITFILTVVLLITALRLRLPRGWVTAVLGVEVVQIIVGITQANTGLPAGLVITHMMLAGALVAVTTGLSLSSAPSAGRTAVDRDAQAPSY